MKNLESLQEIWEKISVLSAIIGKCGFVDKDRLKFEQFSKYKQNMNGLMKLNTNVVILKQKFILKTNQWFARKFCGWKLGNIYLDYDKY